MLPMPPILSRMNKPLVTIIQRWVGLTGFICFAFSLGVSVTFLPNQGLAGPRKTKVCWPPTTLKSQQKEKQILKHVRRAFVPRPKGNPRAAHRDFRPIGGNIRRVNLPQGVKRIAFTFDLCEQPYEIAGYQGGIVDYPPRQQGSSDFFCRGEVVAYPSASGRTNNW